MQKSKQQLAKLQQKCRDLATELESLKRYQNYLTSVVNQTDNNYTMVDELLQRYNLLNTANDNLMNSVSIGQKNIEKY